MVLCGHHDRSGGNADPVVGEHDVERTDDDDVVVDELRLDRDRHRRRHAVNRQLTGRRGADRLPVGGGCAELDRLGEHERRRRELGGVQGRLHLVIAPALVGGDRGHVGLDRHARDRGPVDLERAADVRGAPDRCRRADARELLVDTEPDERAGRVLVAELADRRVDRPRPVDARGCRLGVLHLGDGVADADGVRGVAAEEPPHERSDGDDDDGEGGERPPQQPPAACSAGAVCLFRLKACSRRQACSSKL